ncbi:MAG TPA: OstA-like protein, partial [Flavisolibacter sp.]|nr:OstA-like protein [Flavisolibacter sp.]
MNKQLFFFFLFLFSAFASVAQTRNADTTQPVNIIYSDNLYWRKLDAGIELQILSGKVQLRQGNTLFFCDSCVINNAANTFEAFGKVHINEDTTDVYSDYLR